MLHSDKRSVVNQIEVGTDAPSVHAALDQVLRRDPDVVAVGALPDADTTLRRRPHRRPLPARPAGAGAVAAGADGPGRPLSASGRAGGGRGRIPAVEVLVSNGPVAEALVEPDGRDRLEELVTTGEFWGMQTFDQSLAGLCRRGVVERETALAHATYEPGLRLTLDAMEQERSLAATPAAS